MSRFFFLIFVHVGNEKLQQLYKFRDNICYKKNQKNSYRKNQKNKTVNNVVRNQQLLFSNIIKKTKIFLLFYGLKWRRKMTRT
jgi:hypothetical protein